MNSDVEVKISWPGGPFSDGNNIQTSVTGISVVYAVNAIPVVRLSVAAPVLAESAPNLLCNPDPYKSRQNSPIFITIRSKTGCLRFTGYFDGLSIIQTPGGFDYSIMIKNQLQPLLEIYPRLMGVLPGSVNPLTAWANFSIDPGNAAVLGAFDPFFVALQSLIVGVGNIQGKSITTVIVDTTKRLLKEQDRLAATLVQNGANALPNYNLIALLNDDVYKAGVALSQRLLEQLDTTYSKNCIALASAALPELIDIFNRTDSSVWDMVLEACQEVACSVVVGNSKAWLVPQANFLKFPEGDVGDTINSAIPSDYNNFVVSDTGYKNIRACYVTNDGTNYTTPQGDYYQGTLNWGSYPNKNTPESEKTFNDGSTGILVIPSSKFLYHNVNSTFCSRKILDRQRNKGKSSSGKPAGTPEDINKEKTLIADSNIIAQAEYAKTVMDAYAKAKFLQEKYRERVGSFSMLFNPAWVPGSTGKLYSALPGMYFNFYVDSVVHSIQMQSPKSGSANTQISFSSCRYNGNSSNIPGIEEDSLYKYDSNQMNQFQHDWVKDVSG